MKNRSLMIEYDYDAASVVPVRPHGFNLCKIIYRDRPMIYQFYGLFDGFLPYLVTSDKYQP